MLKKKLKLVLQNLFDHKFFNLKFLVKNLSVQETPPDYVSVMLFSCSLFIRTDLSSKCLVEGGGLGAVVCVGWYLSNGAHLAVGRHDGSVQLYLVDLDNVNEKPRLKFTYVSTSFKVFRGPNRIIFCKRSY